MTLPLLLVDATVRSSLVVAAALGAVWLLRHRSAAVRHWVLAAAVVCAAVAPALRLTIPSWSLPFGSVGRSSAGAREIAAGSGNEGALFELSETVTAAGASARTTAPSTAGLIAGVWLAGVGIHLGILMAGAMRLSTLASRSTRVADGPWARMARDIARAYGLRRSVTLLEGAHPTLLATWGAARTIVMLPRAARAWPEDRVRIVLGHELAHVMRRDWTFQMIAECLRAVYWFNPLMALACRRLRDASEQACDDAVIDGGVTAADYAAELLSVAAALRPDARVPRVAAAVARPSGLQRRITVMLKPSIDRRPATRLTRFAALAALLALTAAVASAQSAFATFSGTIADQTGGVLPDVRVLLSNEQTKAKYEVRTDAGGRFQFVGLPGGDYTLEALQPGFRVLQDRVTVSPRQTLDRNLELVIGSLQETITIRRGPGRDAPAPPAARAGSARSATIPPPPPCTQAGVARQGSMGGNIKQPMKIVDVKPVYPERLQAANAGGVVALDTIIGTDGLVKEVRVVPPADPDLAEAAVAAVSQWQFTPTYLNCLAVEVPMAVRVNFTSAAP